VASGGTSLTPDQLRLIKKYTKNLTIIYDGDSAGIKAAMRGLDLALDEGLNVKLVLIPDKEDPDSYVNKIGAEAFQEFVKKNKRDFILFQLDILLKDAGDDTNKKAAIANQVAETISRLNKAEDFTKQQDYIRRCADILHIDETGMNNLVNKFIRDKVQKQEKLNLQNQPGQQGGFGQQGQPQPFGDHPPDDFFYDDGFGNESGTQPSFPGDDTAALFNKDEQSERAMIRCLLEFGLKQWDDNRRIADYIFEESVEKDMLDNKDLVKVMDIYKIWYDEGIEPGPKNFIYHEDLLVSATVVSLMDTPHELSPNWKSRYEGKINTRDDTFHQETFSVVNYLKLRKIKRLMDDNQKDMQRPHSPEEQMVLLHTHIHLKKLEQEMLKQIGTVILK
jgi:DNA primase